MLIYVKAWSPLFAPLACFVLSLFGQFKFAKACSYVTRIRNSLWKDTIPQFDTQVYLLFSTCFLLRSQKLFKERAKLCKLLSVHWRKQHSSACDILFWKKSKGKKKGETSNVGERWLTAALEKHVILLLSWRLSFVASSKPRNTKGPNFA